jgi:hypothetical protein
VLGGVHGDEGGREQVGAVAGEDVGAEYLAAGGVEHELDPAAAVAERAALDLLPTSKRFTITSRPQLRPADGRRTNSATTWPRRNALTAGMPLIP